MLGHSIGEYVAAHLAAVMSLEDALALVATRGRLMQACLPGSMAAVHLPPKELAPLLPEGIEIAAVNAAALCAVSGQTDRLGTWLKTLDAKGVKFALLKTSHAFHSSMMEQALPDFIAGFANITLSAPAIPYVSNLTGTWITPQEATSPEYYGRQLRHSVQFRKASRPCLRTPRSCFSRLGPALL